MRKKIENEDFVVDFFACLNEKEVENEVGDADFFTGCWGAVFDNIWRVSFVKLSILYGLIK